jgi:hypothetical protein
MGNWNTRNANALDFNAAPDVAAGVRRRNSIAARNPPPHVGGYALDLEFEL